MLYGITGSPDRIEVPAKNSDGTIDNLSSKEIVSLVPNFWLKWECKGTTKPEHLSNVSKKKHKLNYPRLSKALESKTEFTEQEWKKFGIDPHLKIRRYHYITVHEQNGKRGKWYYQPIDPGKFGNGMIDEDHEEGMRLSDFKWDPSSVDARLSYSQVLALRLYTTAFYKSINTDLRGQILQTDSGKHQQLKRGAVQFPVTTLVLADAIAKLRVRNANDSQYTRNNYLWRGMRDLTFSSDKLVGTEHAAMSTTADLKVALRYSAPGEGHKSILLQIRADNPMKLGADLSYLSAFPREKEFLYPPLTYLDEESRYKVTVDDDVFQVFVVTPTYPSS